MSEPREQANEAEMMDVLEVGTTQEQLNEFMEATSVRIGELEARLDEHREAVRALATLARVSTCETGPFSGVEEDERRTLREFLGE